MLRTSPLPFFLSSIFSRLRKYRASIILTPKLTAFLRETAMTRLEIYSDQKDRIISVIKAAISSEISRLEIGLEKTNRRIENFENEYSISSDVFLQNYAAEDLKNGDEGYIRWAGELKLRERIMEDLNNLRDIEYVAS